ncbi:hypothetical protein BOX15_Mlig013815g1 [Macrostomum lignano]|uniref:Laminin G domain-containing protein n=1 Tax=Macrostomum lignano TaxID=282301 RepID=A0A267D9T9_9PLAT|nr:hypothetical protein BOX15_Mlig013815g3 [Macrostomum lignano]PAA65019.1 hypothetical protein BOX15_Mlig013815g1 [Macrostomum lignano]
MAIKTTAVLPLLLLLSGPLASLAVHFELGLPDLIATKRTKDGEVTIKGYRATTNEALLATNRSDIAPQLLWATVGDPRIIKSEALSATGFNTSKKVFHFTDTGFYMMMQLKTKEDSELLAKRAVLKYGLPIAPNQVRHLLLSKLTCVMDLRDTDRRSVKITGAPSRLDRFPLKVEFKSPPGSESRSLFEKRLIDDPDMSVPCSICLSSLSIDAGPDEIAGDANATNITESSVLPVPPDDGINIGGGVTGSDCRRWQPPTQGTLARELNSVASNLSGLACDVSRLEKGRYSPALTAALRRARAACDRLPPSASTTSALLANLTKLLEQLRGLSATEPLRHRLALRAVYSLAGGRTHSLLDSRRLRARPKPKSAAVGLLGSDGARFSELVNAGLVVTDETGGEMSDLMDEEDTDWTFFAKFKLTETASPLPRPLMTFWNSGSRRLVQLSVGAGRLASVLASERSSAAPKFGDLKSVASYTALTSAILPGAWHSVAVISPIGALVLDGRPLTAGFDADATVASASPAAALPTDRPRLWLGAAPPNGGGFGGVIGCFGAAAAALSPAEIEAAIAAYCG